ncbi:hypothetical protein [Deinococcus gobiensis]|uniref:Uncharacterized protein n=1 Tax=Deinococcus gobiensis (strain DSM 21396 / JCM 16679 / CGMCC 1.7299 / I-0) TaxID=745776 RepID=H8H326_DEIGI|nr:hypothetical protein [Deinococcus gobiensis]AFD27923.1 hypothetical protein DGo_PC0131 [Deinococcus gobiensis I-0]
MTPSFFRPFCLLLTLGTAGASSGTDFARQVLDTPEVQLARTLGLNSLTPNGTALTGTRTGVATQATAPLTLQRVQQQLKTAGFPNTASLQSLNVITVPYTAQQIATYAGRAVDLLDDQRWTYTIHADFQRAQVVVNLDKTHHAALRALLGDRIPEAALRLGQAPQLRPVSGDGSATTSQYIQDRNRPYGAGARIISGSLECSAGWFGRNPQGEIMLVTAAHCVDPRKTTQFFQTQDFIGTTSTTHRRGIDAIAIRLNNLNYNPNVLYADDWNGRILKRLPQNGPANSFTGAQKITLAGATSYRREWQWFSHFNRIAVQRQVVETPSGFTVDATEYCIVASYAQAGSPNQVNRQPQGGDSGGILLNERNEVLGHISVVGTFDPSLPTSAWEKAYCFVPWTDAQQQTGLFPLNSPGN